MAGTNQSVPKYKRHEKKVKDERDYVDKDAFYQALVEYNQQLRYAEDNYLDEPKPSDFIGSCIMMIVDRVIKSHRFKGYTDLWKDEMRSEALVSAVKSIKKFDVDRFDNPFAYFTTVVYYNFYNTINKERKAHKAILEHDREENLNYTDIGADGFSYHVSDIVLERQNDDYDWDVTAEAYDDYDWSKKAENAEKAFTDDNSSQDDETYSQDENEDLAASDDDREVLYDDDSDDIAISKEKLEHDYMEISYKIETEYQQDEILSDDDDKEMTIDKLL